MIVLMPLPWALSAWTCSKRAVAAAGARATARASVDSVRTSYSSRSSVGGHCLPIDPSYLQWRVRRAVGNNFRFIDIANDINEHMPELINPEHVPSFVRIVPLTTEHVERADLVLVLTDHDALDWSLLEQWPARILDTRNRVKAPEAERL
jgi:UDP-N-acetyl-D-mannosaminuronate dehydrogenase